MLRGHQTARRLPGFHRPSVIASRWTLPACPLLNLALVLLAVSPAAAQSPAASSAPARDATASSPAADTPSPEEKNLLRMVGDGAILLRTPHFIVAHNSEAKVVGELINRLEHTYHSIYRFCEATDIPSTQSEQPLEVLFFEQRQAYDRYCVGIRFPPAGTYGVYYEPTNRSAFFNVATDPQVITLGHGIVIAQRGINELARMSGQMQDLRTPVRITWADGSQEVLTAAQLGRRIGNARSELRALESRRRAYIDNINQTVVQHEIAHQTLFNAGVHIRGVQNPKWLVEGLACMFETPPSSKGIGIGALNQMRLDDFRKAVGGEESRRLAADDLLTAISDGRMIDPLRLVSDSDVFVQNGEAAATCYALTWALTHYLSRTQRGKLGAFIRELRAREPGQAFTDTEELELFEKHFGTIDETWLRRFGGYILRIPFGRVGGRM